MGLVRLLLALAVVVSHSAVPFGRGIFRLTGGVAAVQLFYVISGFYMALVLNRKYRGTGALRVFYANRFLRLYPTYAVVALASLAAGLGGLRAGARPICHVAEWVAHWRSMAIPTRVILASVNGAMIGQDAAMFLAVDPGNGRLYFTADFWREPVPAWHFLLVPQAWTIGVEAAFYLVAPTIVRRGPLPILAIAIPFVVLRRFLLSKLHLGDPWTYRFFPTELPLFLAGAFAYHAYDWMDRKHLIGRRAGVAALAAVLAMLVVFAKLPHRGIAGFPWEYGAFALSLPWLFHLTSRSRFDRWLGELSYAVYLCHILGLEAVREWRIPMIAGDYGLTCCLLSLAMAAAIERGVERPIDRFRQRLSVRQANATPNELLPPT